jgi:hypothetical protein
MNYDASNDIMNTNTCEECVTPTRERSSSPLVCPGAPRRRLHRQPSATDGDLNIPFIRPRILIPTLDTHRNRGILATDFIKPDPTATAAERRAHILRELQTWLVHDMRIQTHAREVEYNCLPDLEAEVFTGTWPAARLCLVAARGNFDRIHEPHERLYASHRADSRPVGSQQDTTEHYHSAATWAYWICYNYLTEGTQPVNDQEDLALGFVTTDRFADGTTIEDLWNWSPTHRLRTAPPLPDSDAEDEETEDTDIEDSVCFQRVRIEAPAWMWLAVFFGSIFYIWLVAYLVGAATSR